MPKSSASSEARDFQTWLNDLINKGGKNGLYSKRTLSLVKQLLEADAKYPSGRCSKDQLPEELRAQHDPSKFHDWRNNFALEHGEVVKMRRVNGVVSLHIVGRAAAAAAWCGASRECSCPR